MNEGWVRESWNRSEVNFGGDDYEFVEEIGLNEKGKRIRSVVVEYKMEREMWWD